MCRSPTLRTRRVVGEPVRATDGARRTAEATDDSRILHRLTICTLHSDRLVLHRWRRNRSRRRRERNSSDKGIVETKDEGKSHEDQEIARLQAEVRHLQEEIRQLREEARHVHEDAEHVTEEARHAEEEVDHIREQIERLRS